MLKVVLKVLSIIEVVSRAGLEPDEAAVVKWSYSRATFCSFPLTPSHWTEARKRLTLLTESCDIRTDIGEREMGANQIPPLAPQ